MEHSSHKTPSKSNITALWVTLNEVSFKSPCGLAQASLLPCARERRLWADEHLFFLLCPFGSKTRGVCCAGWDFELFFRRFRFEGRCATHMAGIVVHLWSLSLSRLAAQATELYLCVRCRMHFMASSLLSGFVHIDIHVRVKNNTHQRHQDDLVVLRRRRHMIKALQFAISKVPEMVSNMSPVTGGGELRSAGRTSELSQGCNARGDWSVHCVMMSCR